MRIFIVTQEENEIPSNHALTSPRLLLPPSVSYCTELVFAPDLTTVTARKWMLLNIGCCKIVNI